MPATINPIRKAKVKRALLQGKSARQALREAGYTKATITHSTNAKVVKCSLSEIAQEIQRDFKLEEITPQFVISGLRKEALTAYKSADRNRAFELLGKYLALFTDKIDSDVNITEDKTIRQNRVKSFISELLPAEQTP